MSQNRDNQPRHGGHPEKPAGTHNNSPEELAAINQTLIALSKKYDEANEKDPGRERWNYRRADSAPPVRPSFAYDRSIEPVAIRPVSDKMQWGVADHWSDPFETFLSNRGDCEDYAILKYAALLAAGIPKNDVKIVILKNFFPNEDHAAVATRVDGQWLILDNRTLTLVRDTDITRAIPEFVLDHEGVKRFKWENQNRRVGS
jgi:hypothetical protein